LNGTARLKIKETWLTQIKCLTAYHGYPTDFLFRYQRGVEATTAADVQRVARTYLKPENLVTLVVAILFTQ